MIWQWPVNFTKVLKLWLQNFVIISHLSITYLQGENNAGIQGKAKKYAMIHVIFQNPNNATAKDSYIS